MVPKGAPKSPLGAIFGTFGVLVPAFCRALGHLWPTWGPTVDLVGFRGPGRPPGVSRRQGRSGSGVVGKHYLGLAGEGST